MEPTETMEVIRQTICSSGTAFTTFWMVLNLILTVAVGVGLSYLVFLLIKALRKYLRSEKIRKETAILRKSLGETLKEHRIQNKMTQEFVAEHLGVSRQAVSKWESNSSDPSTSNLLALAKLYGISADALLKEVSK